jgi:hypothetical protein
VSYDLAVWVGERPADGEAADEHYEKLMELLEEDDAIPPSEPIQAYVETLLERWPDLDEAPDSPWTVSPLMEDAVGDVFYFGIKEERAEEVSDYAAVLAEEHGLVCYDPQMGELRP